MGYCPECGANMGDRDFCLKCKGVNTFKGKYVKIDIIESNSLSFFMHCLNEAMVYGGTPLFESFNVVRSTMSPSLTTSPSTTEKYFILIGFKDRLHHENYLKMKKEDSESWRKKHIKDFQD